MDASHLPHILAVILRTSAQARLTADTQRFVPEFLRLWQRMFPGPFEQAWNALTHADQSVGDALLK